MRKPIHTAAQDRFLAVLKSARKSAELTQAELAGRLKKPQSFIAKYENGERRLDVLEFVAVCRVIEADAAEIVRELASKPMPRRRSRKSGRAGSGSPSSPDSARKP